MNLDGAVRKLHEHHERWNKKPGIRLIYRDYFNTILDHCVNGKTLEVGAGFGAFKDYSEHTVSTDIVRMKRLDVVCDAHYLPFASASFSNIVAIDFLHHLERPIKFLQQAADILRIGGRLVVLEPAITPVGRLLYALHNEPVDMSANPFEDGPLSVNRRPFDANQAIGTLLVRSFNDELGEKVPEFKLIHRRWKGLVAYPLSGGFRRWTLLPYWMIEFLLKFEEYCLPWVGQLMACRLLIVFERVNPRLTNDRKNSTKYC